MRLFGKRFSSLLAACGVALSCLGATMSSAVASPLVSSSFDSGREGWKVIDLNDPAVTSSSSAPTVTGSYDPMYKATGGSEGGYLSMTDPSGKMWYWSAPTKFLGNQAAAYGGSLQFTLKQDLFVNQFNREDIILVGGGRVLSFNTAYNPGTAFTSYDIDFSETGWHLGSLSGAAATQADMLTVLGSLSAIYIRGEYRSGADTGGLDSVILSAPAGQGGAVPEPASAALVAAGLLPLLLKTRRRKGA